MTTESKLALIEVFDNLSNAFDDTLNLEREAVLFRPFSDSWSIIEQVVHCADFDIAMSQISLGDSISRNHCAFL